MCCYFIAPLTVRSNLPEFFVVTLEVGNTTNIPYNVTIGILCDYVHLACERVFFRSRQGRQTF